MSADSTHSMMLRSAQQIIDQDESSDKKKSLLLEVPALIYLCIPPVVGVSWQL